MASSDMVVYEEEYRAITSAIARLHADANARIVFLVDKSGQLIASHGETQDIDTTSLASLAAGNIAATGGLAQLLGEKEFANLFHEGERDNLHISIVGKRGILVVIFDERSSLGLVRLRVRKATEELDRIFEELETKSLAHSMPRHKEVTPFSEISDEEIDSLFS
ncbi:MAG: roadblock/LC7 domain-containing protein [Candidatus Schekmanbacteria bacterium]|nr:roadblock/LC7 domain-containing protein [Candidatus Schekmanbacteria bacterium]